MTRAEHVKALLAEYAEQRAKDEREQQQRLEDAVARQPEIGRLRQENADLVLGTMRRMLGEPDLARRKALAEETKARGREINARIPNDYGSGECYGFAQFIGYLLSGEKNPHGNWKRYYSVGAAGGLRPGDIVRAEYEMGGYKYMHSAVVYSVEGNTVLFLQVAGAQYNLIRTRQGYTDGYLKDETDLRKIRSLPNIIVYRSREAR